MDFLEKMGICRRVRFRMYTDGTGAASAAVLMGAAFFLRVLYHLGFTYVGDIGAGELILDLILPALLCGAFAVMLKGFRFGMLRVYAIMAAVYCVLMMAWTYDPDAIIHFALSIIWYLVTVVVLFGTVEGYISNRLILQLAFFLPVCYRFFLFDLGKYILTVKIIEFLPEASCLCGLLALSSFSRCLMPERLHNHR